LVPPCRQLGEQAGKGLDKGKGTGMMRDRVKGKAGSGAGS